MRSLPMFCECLSKNPCPTCNGRRGLRLLGYRFSCKSEPAICTIAKAANGLTSLKPTDTRTSTAQERKRKMAMTRVLERLYLGDARDADHLSVSNPFGITAVVNVNTAPNDSKRDEINYVHFPLGESCRV